jgi:hypothetical protein
MLFGKKSVDSIMAGFTKMIDDLEEVISEETLLNVKRDEEIELMRQAQAKSTVEIGRAANIKKGLNAILNPIPMSKRIE